MLMPKKTKFRKQFRGKRRGIATKGNRINFGDYALQCMENAWVDSRQIEAGRIAINRYIKREGKMWIRLFPYKPVSAKPIEVRMGKGKGDTAFWVDVVKRGRIMYELEGVDENTAKIAFRRAQAKFSIKTRFIKRK